MKKLALAVLLVAAGCATTGEPEPLPPVTPAPDPRIGELQTTLTELLDRMDVMNERLARLESAAAAPPVTAAPAVVPAPPAAAAEVPPAVTAPQATTPALVSANIAEDYRKAIMLFGQGRHADARRAFQEVFEADPGGDLADNALFWIGETYYAAADYANAVRHYQRVVNEYPEENKAPDAMLKMALAQERTGDLALARRTLQEIVERYPYSSTASTAKSELQRIRY